MIYGGDSRSEWWFFRSAGSRGSKRRCCQSYGSRSHVTQSRVHSNCARAEATMGGDDRSISIQQTWIAEWCSGSHSQELVAFPSQLRHSYCSSVCIEVGGTSIWTLVVSFNTCRMDLPLLRENECCGCIREDAEWNGASSLRDSTLGCAAADCRHCITSHNFLTHRNRLHFDSRCFPSCAWWSLPSRPGCSKWFLSVLWLCRNPRESTCFISCVSYAPCL